MGYKYFYIEPILQQRLIVALDLSQDNVNGPLLALLFITAYLK